MKILQIDNEQREYLSSLKMNETNLFNDRELDFLLEHSKCEIYEFTQETETDSDVDFYHHFIEWIKELPHHGYVYYYIIAGMKKGENLSDDEFDYLERNITECFDTGYGWIAQTNKERRFKRRIKLVLFEKHNGFRRLIPLNFTR